MRKYFELAIKEAKKAYKKGEIPVGSVIIKDNKVLSTSHNNRQFKHCVTGHAEINCVIKAEKKIKDWRLDGCVMFVTLEPCEMCKLIIKESRIKNTYYLLSQDKNELVDTIFTQTKDCEDLKKMYQELLNNFFINLRK